MSIIRPAALAIWAAWNAPLEGRVNWMYPDTLGYVTTAEGNLLPDVVAAQRLPWQYTDGTPATPEQIAVEFNRMSGNLALGREGAIAAHALATLCLPDPALDSLVETAETAEAATLLNTPEFGAFATWPADAQLGLLSMGWAMGAGFAQRGKWPHFRGACAARDWLAASRECAMQDAGGDISRRNNATALAFRLARNAEIGAADPAILQSPVPAS